MAAEEAYSTTLPRARLSHSVPGRLRLRLPEPKGDASFFVHMEEAVGKAPGVEEAWAASTAGCRCSAGGRWI